jgi:hypothetical protein
MLPGWAKRGGATGHAQNTTRQTKLVSTRAERNHGYCSGRRHHMSPSTIGVTKKCMVP